MIADELAAADPQVHVLHRPGKQGLGAAYLAGFALGPASAATTRWWRWTPTARTPRRSCPRCWTRARDADVVIGSRWVRGGTVVNWPLHRLVLSRGGNLYTRLALGMPVQDATGGYRVYRMTALDKMTSTTVASQGYCFQVDLAWRAYRTGSGSSRCRSRSPSGSGGQQDELVHRRARRSGGSPSGGAGPAARVGGVAVMTGGRAVGRGMLEGRSCRPGRCPAGGGERVPRDADEVRCADT